MLLVKPEHSVVISVTWRDGEDTHTYEFHEVHDARLDLDQEEEHRPRLTITGTLYWTKPEGITHTYQVTHG